MRFRDYLKDKLFYIITSFLFLVILILTLKAFKLELQFIIFVIFLILCLFITFILYGYFRRKNYYNKLFHNIDNLDKAYLVLETLEKPSFYDGMVLYDALYDINKSMTENVKEKELEKSNFKEYIEMWIHEVKVPLSALTLQMHNNEFDNKMVGQIKKIDSLVEQVLYYSRVENAEKDYLIKKVKLEKVINDVALKNKDDILENKIDFIVSDVDVSVNTDTKWLVFIINQIINNSIKYKRNIKNSYIKIYATENDSSVKLYIADNGIGIPKEDIRRVFDKSFTGQNGRVKSKSTGMGLYIARKLCMKLGHKIEISSSKGSFTKVCITFYKNNYYEVLN